MPLPGSGTAPARGKEALCFPVLGLWVPFTALTVGMKAYFMSPRGHPGPEPGQELPSCFWEKLVGRIIVGFILPCLLGDFDGVQCLPPPCTAKASWCRDGMGMGHTDLSELSFLV